MKITIKNINSVCSVTLPGSSQLGYVADFETPLVKGTATVVPSAGRNDTLVAGRVIEVDIKQDHVSQFEKLDRNKDGFVETAEAKAAEEESEESSSSD